MPYIGKQASANSKIKKYSFTVALSPQQDFTVSSSGDDELQVFLNGVLLQANVDYTASTTQVSLTSNAVLNDILDVHIYQSFVLADAATSAELTTSEATSKATSVAMAVALGG